MHRLDLVALRYFAEAARCGSIRQAAERLYVTPSAVSKQIAKLESALGVALMVRHVDGVHMTPAGWALLEEVGKIQSMADSVHARMRAIESLEHGHVSICSMEGAQLSWLPRMLKLFHDQHPQVRYDVHTSNAAEVVERLLSHQCDIGLTAHIPKRPEIERVVSGRSPLLALVHRQHPWAGRAVIHIEELLGQVLVQPSHDLGLRRALDEGFQQYGGWAKEIVTTHSIHSMRAMAREGLGIAVLPYFSAQLDIECRRLHALEIVGSAHMYVDVSLCVRRNHPLSAAPKALLQLMQAHFGDLLHRPVLVPSPVAAQLA